MGPRAIILPEGQTDEERREFLDCLCRQYEGLVDELLAHRRDVLDESRKDLRQMVLLILCNHVVKTRRVPELPRRWLGDVIRKQVRNHKDRWRPPIQEGADAEAVAASSGQGPERAADLAGRRATLEECLAELTEDEAAVVRCVDLYDMSLEETAKALRKPLSTVFDLARKMEKKLARRVRGL
jgi:RNA polymerase sigma factor (sigma-70 family)